MRKCQSVTITWTGQTPFHVTVLDDNEDGAILSVQSHHTPHRPKANGESS